MHFCFSLIDATICIILHLGKLQFLLSLLSQSQKTKNKKKKNVIIIIDKNWNILDIQRRRNQRTTDLKNTQFYFRTFIKLIHYNYLFNVTLNTNFTLPKNQAWVFSRVDFPLFLIYRCSPYRYNNHGSYLFYEFRIRTIIEAK